MSTALNATMDDMEEEQDLVAVETTVSEVKAVPEPPKEVGL
jgi:hypothetical protein